MKAGLSDATAFLSLCWTTARLKGVAVQKHAGTCCQTSTVEAVGRLVCSISQPNPNVVCMAQQLNTLSSVQFLAEHAPLPQAGSLVSLIAL